MSSKRSLFEILNLPVKLRLVYTIIVNFRVIFVKLKQIISDSYSYDFLHYNHIFTKLNTHRYA